MDYTSCIDWLFTQFPAFQHLGKKAYKPSLNHIIALCEKFEIEHQKLRFIHIAGTNGKGSCSNFTASILQEAGYKTGLFTSPHILDFSERIRVNGDPIPPEKVIHFCQKIQAEPFDIQPSFFEITWALALTHFIDEGCEICVIETGLGGRLDATNIIQPLVSVITNIDLDHTDILGDTLEKIAFEKAGIIKKNTAVVLGEMETSLHPIFEEKAKELHAPVYFSNSIAESECIFPAEIYQQENEKTVRKTIEVLQNNGFSITSEQIQKGILQVGQNTGFKGRFQIIQQEPLTILDLAHNPAGVKRLLLALKKVQKGKLHVIYGASADKNLKAIISLFPSSTLFYFCEFKNPRTASLAQFREISEKLNLSARFFTSVSDANENAQQSINKNDTLLITGSFFLLSDFF